MKNFLEKTGIILTAFLLIMTTGGFSIYHHFCGCAGEETSSFFIKPTCEHENRATRITSCCHAEVPACCAEKAQDQPHNSCTKDKCCSHSETFFKISDNYNVSLPKISLKFVASFIQVLHPVLLMNEPGSFLATTPEFNDTSPPLYGTELLHQLHQLKIAHPLV